MRCALWLLLLPLVLCGCSRGGDRDCAYGGMTHRSGTRFPSLDGCNSCSCLDGQVACTERACLQDMAEPGGDAAGPADDAAGEGGGQVMCGAGMGVFPTFDRRCGRLEDCDIGVHQIDCCGSQQAIGLSKGARPAFDAAERLCREQYPKCRCAARPTVAEDGRSELDGTIAVRCEAMACTTYVR